MLIKKITSGYVNENGEFFKTRRKEIEAREDKDYEFEYDKLLEDLE